MSQPFQNTAILFFSRSVNSENQQKRILKGKNTFANKSLVSNLIKNVRKCLLDVSLPVFWINEEGQRGETFGEKLQHAFDDIYAKGFDHVIAVELASESGLLSGEISGNNIRGPEKARRLRQWIGPTDVEIWAYGNSSGDKEMLSMADHSRWV